VKAIEVVCLAAFALPVALTRVGPLGGSAVRVDGKVQHVLLDEMGSMCMGSWQIEQREGEGVGIHTEKGVEDRRLKPSSRRVEVGCLIP
jgi:hypothetical protein